MSALLVAERREVDAVRQKLADLAQASSAEWVRSAYSSNDSILSFRSRTSAAGPSSIPTSTLGRGHLLALR